MLKYIAAQKGNPRQEYDRKRTSPTMAVSNDRLRQSYTIVLHRILPPYTMIEYDHSISTYFLVYDRLRSQAIDLGENGRFNEICLYSTTTTYKNNKSSTLKDRLEFLLCLLLFFFQNSLPLAHTHPHPTPLPTPLPTHTPTPTPFFSYHYQMMPSFLM